MSLTVKDIWREKVGNEITIDAKISSLEIKMSSRDEPYADIVLSDNEKTICAKFWRVTTQDIALLKTLSYARIIAIVGEYNSVRNLTISNIDKIPEKEFDESKFERITSQKKSEMIRYLEEVINKIDDKAIKTIVLSRWKKNKGKFIKFPAARKMHHNYTSGLLHHTYTMLKLAENQLEIYPEKLDKDIVFGAIVLHDIDKVREYSAVDNPEFTELGNLYGHIFMSAAETYHESKLLYEKDNTINFSKVKYLIHAILAHHGKLEWGSPVTPQTIEAQAVHQIDLVDSRMNQSI